MKATALRSGNLFELVYLKSSWKNCHVWNIYLIITTKESCRCSNMSIQNRNYWEVLVYYYLYYWKQLDLGLVKTCLSSGRFANKACQTQRGLWSKFLEHEEQQWMWLTIPPQHVHCECAFIKGQTHSPELSKSNHIV